MRRRTGRPGGAVRFEATATRKGPRMQMLGRFKEPGVDGVHGERLPPLSGEPLLGDTVGEKKVTTTGLPQCGCALTGSERPKSKPLLRVRVNCSTASTRRS